MKLSDFVLTAKGRALLGKLMQGRCTTTFSNVKVSSIRYTKAQLSTVNTLPAIWKQAAVTKLLIVDSSTVQIEASMDNMDLTEDKVIGTVGLYAMDPDEREILYALASVEDGSILPAFAGEKTAVGLAFRFDIAVSDSAKIDVKVDPNGYATVRDARALRAALMALAEAVASGNVGEDLVAQLRSGMLDITGDNNNDINVLQPVIDKTLTQDGSAADAKATGDLIDANKKEANSAMTKLDNYVKGELKKVVYSTTLEHMKSEIVSAVEAAPEGGIRVVFADNTDIHIPIATESGLNFDAITIDDGGYLHITCDGEDVVEPCYIGNIGGGGSSGGGSKLTFASYTPPSVSVMENVGAATISFKFSSIDAETDVSTGPGNLAIIVNGTLRTNMTIQQGENLSVDVFSYLSKGANSVKLTLTDSYGATATRNFNMMMETFNIEWSLAPTVRNTAAALAFYITPIGSGTKTIHTYVDGVLHSTDNVTTSGRRISKTVSGLNHGAHRIEVWGTMEIGGAIVESNRLSSAIAQIGNSDEPVIAVNWPVANLMQFTTAQIDYMAINPSANPSEVKLYVNGVLQATEIVDQAAHTWSYRPLNSGNITLKIECGGVSQEKTVHIASAGIDVEEVTDSLQLKIDPASMTSLTEWQQGDYRLTLSQGFDLVNGGLQVDSDGIHCIRITAGDRITLNYDPFTGDAKRTGKAVKIVYRVADSSNKEAVAINAMVGGIGLEVQANRVTLSGDQTTVTMSTCEDEKTELDVNIERTGSDSDQLMFLWEKCSTFAYKKYASGENFTHVDASGISFGSDDADVYLYMFRAYSRDLTDAERKANFIADGPDGAEIISRQKRNDIYVNGVIDREAAVTANPNCHFITINASRMTKGKKDAVECTVEHIYASGGPTHQFTAPARMKVQGTSSVEHAQTAGPNINFDFYDGITLADGTHLDGYAMRGEDKSIPTKLLTFKKNIASEDHIVNIMCAEHYDKFQPTSRANKTADPRLRDCMEAEMCAVFFHNNSDSAVQVGPDTVLPDETIFFGLGNLCSNKDAVEVFGYEPIVIEVKNNTEAPCRFKSADMANFDNNFEFRYLDEERFSENQAKAMFADLLAFCVSCDVTAATGDMLLEDTVIDGQLFRTDSIEYRKAKWRAEAPSHLDMQGMYWHYNFTLFHLLRDNRAKNMFWSYDPVTSRWNLRFNWDNDTGHCRNNEGYIDIEPGYMDWDKLGSADVFNGADNTVMVNIRECNAAELQAAYLDRESKGAWDADAYFKWAKERQGSICEALWIEDANHNAIRVLEALHTEAYLERATGRLQLHLKKSLKFQKALVDSYYLATAATANSAAFRGYEPDTWSGIAPSGVLTVTPYTNLFINVLSGSNSYRKRATGGEAVQIDISAALNDTEIYLRSAEWIQDLGDLSALYLGEFEAANLRRCKSFLIGSDEAGYFNTNFTTASFDNCVKLERVNMGGLVNAKRPFDFSRNLYLKEIYTRGSGVTGVTFAKNGRLREARLNAVASLYLNGLRMVETFTLDGYENLSSLTIESCPAIDSYAIASAALNLARVRMLDIDWETNYAAYHVLTRLHRILGIDDEGFAVDHGTLAGKVHFSGIGMTKFNTLIALIPTITFTYGEALDEYTIRFTDDTGNTVYNTQYVEYGGAAQEPVLSGLIEAPTKEPSVEKQWEWHGWDSDFSYVIGDLTVKALFVESDRYYTVNFMDAAHRVLETHSVIAHGSCSYGGKDLESTAGIWAGWEVPTNDVVADMDVNPAFITPTLPQFVQNMSQYEYAYSDDPADYQGDKTKAAYSKAEIAGILITGRAKTYLTIGCKIRMLLSSSVIADSEIIFRAEAFNHFKLADGSGNFAGVVWGMLGALNATRRINPSNTNVGGWPATDMRNWLNNTVFPTLPPFWRSLMKKVIVRSSKGETLPDIVTSEDYLFLRSASEVGFNTDAVPYKDEIDPGAEDIAFALYTDNASRIKKTYNGQGSAVTWWLRSPEASYSTTFRLVSNSGHSGSYGAAAAYSVSACFCT